MDYQVRKAVPEDLPQVLGLYENARSFMASRGNPGQWGKTEPKQSRIEADIREGNLYVVEAQGIHGVFAFLMWEDPTYEVIEQGDWLSREPYGVIHRVASDGSGGILRAAVSYAEQQIHHLRIDTHEKNLPMQAAIGRLGFTYCGVIYTESGSPRLAFERL